MSKNITIQEGNAGKHFANVKRLRISGYPSGDTYWVPEDETKLGTKHISENGTYKASEEKDEKGVNKGLYGYSEVTVSGIGKASGINPVTGEDSIIEPDPVTGELPSSPEDYTDIPSSIGFSNPPSKMSYMDGEPIVLSGATVKAYMKAGGGTVPWGGDSSHPNGVIPLDELTLDPDHASYDSVDEYDADIKNKAGIDEYWKTQTPIRYTVGLESIKQMDDGPYKGGREDGGKPIEWIDADDTVYVLGFKFKNTDYNNQSDFIVCAVSMGEFSFIRVRHNAFGVYEVVMHSGERTVNNKTFQYVLITSRTAFGSDWEIDTNLPLQEVDPMGAVPKGLAYHAGYVVLFGEREGGKQEITVNWERVGDGEVLSEKFKVVVEPVEGVDYDAEDEEDEEDEE